MCLLLILLYSGMNLIWGSFLQDELQLVFYEWLKFCGEKII